MKLKTTGSKLFHHLCAILALLAGCLLSVQSATAASVTSVTADNGLPALAVTWIDGAGQPRTAIMVMQNANGPGYLRRYTYTVNGTPRVCTGTEQFGEFSGEGFVQNHTAGGGDFSSAQLPNPDSFTTVLLGPTNEVVIGGTNHVIIQYDMPSYELDGPYYNPASQKVPTTIQWLFADGRSHPIFSISQDATQAGGNLGADSRSPYGDMAYDGDGVNAYVGGASYGDTYKFVTLAAGPEQVTTSSGWSDTEPNTIPYAMQWAQSDGANVPVNAEMGHVATLPISISDQGMDSQVYNSNATNAEWALPGQPTSFYQDNRNVAQPGGPMIADQSWAYQIFEEDTIWQSDGGPIQTKRLTWGANWGRVGGFDGYAYGYSGVPDADITTYTQHSTDPVGNLPYPETKIGLSADGSLMAYSVFVVFGTHINAAYATGAVGQETGGSVGQVIAQMENAALAGFSATIGTVSATGPAGVGNAANRTITYSPAGFNPTYAAWEITAAGSAVNATLTPNQGQPLDHPIFIVDGYTSSQLPTAIYVGDGLTKPGVDYFATLDSANNRLWITVNRWVTNALNLIVDTSVAGPSISSIPSVAYGYLASITITGENFSGATAVTFNDQTSAFQGNYSLGFTVDSPTQITASFPFGLIGTGPITVTTPYGTATSTSSLDLELHQWRFIPLPQFLWQAFAASLNGSKLVILSSGGQIYHSANSGVSWLATTAPIQNWSSVASSSDGNTLVAASRVVAGANASGQIYLSSDAGATWRLSGAPTNLGWVSIAISTNGTKMVAVGTREIKGTDILNLLYRSTNSGATWTECELANGPWTQIASSSDGTKLVVVSTAGFVYTSTDSGTLWEAKNAPSQPWVSVASSADGSRLLAAAGGSSPGQIYSSSDGGVSWTPTSAPSLDWLNVSLSSDGTQWAAVSTSPSTLLGTVYTATNGGTWTSNSLPNGQWTAVTFTADGNKLITLGGPQMYITPASSSKTGNNTGLPAGNAGTVFTQSYTNTFPTGGNTSPFTGGSVASWVYWYGLNYNNTPMTNDPAMDAQGNPNSGSLKVSLPFGSTGDQGVFFGTFDNQSPYDGSVTLDASYATSLAFDIHFAPGTPLDSTGDLGSITMSIFPGAENGGDFSLFPSVTIPASATNGWFHAAEVITNFIAQEPMAGLTNCDAMGFNYNSYSGYPTSPVTFWIDNVSVVSFKPQSVPSVSWATPSSVVYGTALTSSQLDASASVPGTFVYSPPLGSVPGVSTGQVLSATFTPADALLYQSVTTNVSLKVTPASLTVTANNASRAIGAPNPAFTASFSGFVNGDTASVVSGQPAFSTTVTLASPVGTYPIMPGPGSLSAANYTFAKFVNGTLTLTPAVTPPSGLTWAPAFVPLYYWDALAGSADGTKLFAAASGGEIYASTNAGALWAPTPAPLATWVALSSSSDGTKLAAASSYEPLGEVISGAIYTSSNSGVTWTLSGAPTNFGWFSLAASTNGTKLAAVGTSGGSGAGVVYTSTNSGATWTSNSLPKESWSAIASSADGTRLVVAAGIGQILVSTNGGFTWLATSAPTNHWSAVASSAAGDELVAASGTGSPGRQIYTSSNGGATWTLSSAPSVVWGGVASSPDGSQLIAVSRPLGGFQGSVFTSTNAGATWYSNSLPNAAWTALASSTNGAELVVGNPSGGIYLSPASLIPSTPVPAETWVSNSVHAEQWMSVASSADGTNLVAVGTDPFSLLAVAYTSTNAGAAWTNDSPPTLTYRLTSVASSSDGSRLVAGSSGSSVFVSTNGGAAWMPTSAPPVGWNGVASSTNGINLVAAGYEALYTSADGGVTWVSNNVPAADWTSVGSSADGTKLVAVGTLEPSGLGVIYLSANAGANWSPSAAPNQSWSSVASSADGTKLVAGGNGGPIYVSTDSGATWTATASLLYDWTSVASSADGINLAAGSQNGQLFTSTNSGASWTLTGAPVTPWVSVASSADGSKRVAVSASGQIYTLQTTPTALLSITSQPAGQSVLLGSPVTFGVTAGGTPPITYQWLLGGNPIFGATNSAFGLSSAQLTDAGIYQVVLSGPGGSVTSSNAVLTVFILPKITTPPVGQTVYAGGKATLLVAAGGTGPFSYQWQLNETNLPDNIITTVAGDGSPVFSGNGSPATNTGLSSPSGVAVDASGNLFIADSINHRVDKVDANGIITTVAGNGVETYSGDRGAATNASLSDPSGLTVDASGNLFIADTYNQVIRKVDLNGFITTVAGNGSNSFSGDGVAATNASLSNPSGIALDGSGNLFIADGTNHRIRKVDANGIITTVAGNGTPAYSGDGGAATNASLFLPSGVAVDASGNLFIADQSNNRIRRVDTNGIITTVAGTGLSGYSGDGGLATNASLDLPSGVAVDGFGNLYIADSRNERVREVDAGGFIFTVAGTGLSGYSGEGGVATNASLYNPTDVAVDGFGNLFIADSNNNRIRKVVLDANPALILNNIASANGGNYQVIITSPYGSVTSVVARVTVAVPQLMAVLHPGSGVFLTFTGTPGFTYVFQVAASLTASNNWQPVFTNVADANGNVSFSDTNALNPIRFYRLKLP